MLKNKTGLMLFCCALLSISWSPAFAQSSCDEAAGCNPDLEILFAHSPDDSFGIALCSIQRKMCKSVLKLEDSKAVSVLTSKIDTNLALSEKTRDSLPMIGCAVSGIPLASIIGRSGSALFGIIAGGSACFVGYLAGKELSSYVNQNLVGPLADAEMPLALMAKLARGQIAATPFTPSTMAAVNSLREQKSAMQASTSTDQPAPKPSASDETPPDSADERNGPI